MSKRKYIDFVFPKNFKRFREEDYLKAVDHFTTGFVREGEKLHRDRLKYLEETGAKFKPYGEKYIPFEKEKKYLRAMRKKKTGRTYKKKTYRVRRPYRTRRVSRRYKRRTYKKKSYRKKRNYKRRWGRGQGKLSKPFVARIVNTMQPSEVYKNSWMGTLRHNASNINDQALYTVFTTGTYHHDNSTANFAHNAAGYFEPFRTISGEGWTDMAYTEEKLFGQSDATDTRSGKKGYIQEITNYLRVRNNQNLKCFLTLTYFRPRMKLASENCGADLLDLYAGSFPSLSRVNPHFDWRNVPMAVTYNKIYVKKLSLLPGESKSFKFNCGGMPFLGNCLSFNRGTFDNRFSRFMELRAYGDLIFSDLNHNEISRGPVNLALSYVTRIKGKQWQQPHGNVAEDYSTFKSPNISNPFVVPIGSNQKVEVDDNTA